MVLLSFPLRAPDVEFTINNSCKRESTKGSEEQESSEERRGKERRGGEPSFLGDFDEKKKKN